MPTIAIIDDKKDARTTRERLLEPHVARASKDWGILAAAPFTKANLYPSWIADNDIAAMLIDQKLDDEPPPGQKHSVDYTGTSLVKYLRQHAIDIPIYLVTSFAGPTSKTDNAMFEEVLSKEIFDQSLEVVVTRIIRAGGQYWKKNQDQLSMLSDLSEKIVDGKASKADIKKAKAIREQLALAFDPTDLESRSHLIESLEQAIGGLENSAAQLKKELGKYR